ncbi:nitrate reductase [Afifella sp. IM 167]|nr:nitrate reductase [Afifella sp. IM 167]
MRFLYAPAAILALAGFAIVALPPVAAAQISDVPQQRIDGLSTDYREAGEFLSGNMPVNAPVVTFSPEVPFFVMRRQVTRGEYGACVSAGACRALDTAGEPDLPATGISFEDANTYAAWLSRRTGEVWRLPSDREWRLFAGTRAVDDAFQEGSPDNPAERWLSRYDEEARRREPEEARAQPVGTFGENEHGLLDLSGNVWEWTSTCYARSRIDPATGQIARHDNCGVRIAEGAHRAYLTSFIRDPKSGACSVGRPPTNLGMRLVREEKGFLSGVRSFFGL